MEKEYDYKLTEKESDTVVVALGELPAKISMKVIAKLQSQYQEQIKPKPEEEKTEA